MIRRGVSLAGCDRAWALISQVEHARLAADLARHWRGPLMPASVRLTDRAAVRGEVLAAIEHHDDGWAEWEEAPELDSEHGRPRSFMEMPQAESLAIWSKSIAVAEQIGPLAAWIVAGHFAALLKIGGETRSEEARLAREWSDLMQARRAAWLQDWTESAADHTPETAEQALRALQFFDAASLWVCCTCPPEGQMPGDDGEEAALTFADGTEYRFASNVLRSNRDEEERASIRPWPLAVSEMKLSVECSVVPTGQYHTTDELLQVGRPFRLTWHLCDENQP